MPEEIRPEPTEEEREAILVALRPPAEPGSGWAEAALREGVDPGDDEP